MEQLQAYWIKVRDGFWTLVSKIESSVLFERVVSRYDSLPPRNQKTIKATSTILAMILIAWFAFSPFIKTRLNLAENRSFFSLVSSMKIFNSKLESARKEYVPPIGWQNLPANDMRQLEDSITVLMASLGIDVSQYEIAPQGSTLLVHAKEATIKQLESFMFELDGLYPRYTVVRNKTSRHPDKKELLQFEIEIAPGKVKGAAPSFGANQDLEDSGEYDSLPIEDDSNGGLNMPPTSAARGSTPGANGAVPGFEPPTFTPLDGESDGEYSPSNRGGSEYSPPMEDFTPPPPTQSDDEFDVVPIPDDGMEFPPSPPTE